MVLSGGTTAADCELPLPNGATIDGGITRASPGQSVSYQCNSDSRYPRLIGDSTVSCRNGELVPPAPYCTSKFEVTAIR